MKIGMNSQCLRIIGDDGVSVDYHITDGTTASKFMKYASGTKLQEGDLDTYDSNIVSNEDERMSWGLASDKMTDIYYTDVNYGKVDSMIDSSTKEVNYNSYYPPYYTPRRSTPGTSSHQPITAPIIMSPPLPRHNYSKTTDNENNFKKLFGN